MMEVDGLRTGSYIGLRRLSYFFIGS